MMSRMMEMTSHGELPDYTVLDSDVDSFTDFIHQEESDGVLEHQLYHRSFTQNKFSQP